ncbi:hypothetical protein [Cognatiluteimonas lumbrici]|uniref:hypothetical protein n=1 Tax=Cognatiluteimonas lumbrici TaxID=2559601 RepID=UPI0011278477|nr:hypothetical protein [Luteimonas lumbrici]
MDAIDAPRACPRCLLPGALALLAVLSPACLAQQAQPAPERSDATASVTEATPEISDDGQPRSAFGRVMSLMIAALKENADRPEPAAGAAGGDASLPLEPAAATQEIQVSAAFRLDPPASRSKPRTPASEPLAGAPEGD